MLEYELAETRGPISLYIYYVEGDRNCAGTVEYDSDSSRAAVRSLAEGDDFYWYANHLISRIESEQSIPETGTVMWY